MTTLAARWVPSAGIFAPTTGLDGRLFDEQHHLRPQVRGAVLEKLDQALRVDAGLVGSDWQDCLRVYLAGGSASEWAGARPNDSSTDFDVLIGVNYRKYRGSQASGYPPAPAPAIDSELNIALRRFFSDEHWQPDFGGTWALTGYVNSLAWDIRKIKPYAAWDISDMRWAVRPPHLPEHTVADFEPAVLAEARAVATMARAILRLPEPARTRQASALWEHIHTDRSRAFSAEGEGWQDPGNVIEKYLAYAPGNLLTRIKDLVYAMPKTAVTGYDLEPRSAMIYLDIPEGLVQKVPGGTDDSHITVVYLGKDLDDEGFAYACDRAGWAAAEHYPMKGLLHGIETFPPSDSSDHKVPAFVPAFVPGIGQLRRMLEDLNASKHTDYRPHVTLAYLEPGDQLPPPHPPVHVDFTHLSVQRGDDVAHFPLGQYVANV